MRNPLGEKLEAASVQASYLVGILQLEPEQFKATHLRKSEKSLLLLEDFLNCNLETSLLRWLKRKSAMTVLGQRLQKSSELNTQLAKIEASLNWLAEDLADFEGISDSKQQLLQLTHEKTASYLKENRHMLESATVHRYEKFQKLKGLVQYADNAKFLCDAIRHYENREKYEENRLLLVQKRSSAALRLQNVRQGYYLALLFCILIVTLPICAPFAYSLFKRKKAIEIQMANIEEVIKRETKRIQNADEGVVAAQEIRELLGDVSLDVVSQTLSEVAELRREFLTFQPSQSHTAQLVHFFESEDTTVRLLFGAPPAEVVEKIMWFQQNYELLAEKLTNQKTWNLKKANVDRQITTLLGGRTQLAVKESLDSLKEQESWDPCPWSEKESLQDLVAVLQTLPTLLFSFREFLWKINHGQSVDPTAWKKLGAAFTSQANFLGANSLELSLDFPPETVLPFFFGNTGHGRS